MQIDLFGYPNLTGWKGTETSKAAAKAIDKKPSKKHMVQKTILDMARNHLVWPELVAEYLSKDKEDYYKWLLFVRPRFSELATKGQIIESGQYELNEATNDTKNI